MISIAEKVVEFVMHEEAASSFYKDYYGTVGLSFESLPLLSREMLVKTPFRERIFRHGQLGVRLGKTPYGPLLFARKDLDIRDEPLHVSGSRPLVMFQSTGEHLMWGTWCKERYLLPLMSEESTRLTKNSAQIYETDTLITDTASLHTHGNDVSKVCSKTVKEVLVVEELQNMKPALEALFPSASFAYYAVLPETGIIGSKGERENVWSVPNTIFAEKVNGRLVVTTLIPMPTPLIRYDTEIAIGDFTGETFVTA